MANNVEMPASWFPLPEMTPADEARFHASYVRGDADACWCWQGFRAKKGYGNFSLRDVNYRAHRVSYFLHTGSDPGGLFVCHSCDNPPCVNPKHLWLGTNTENQLDRVAKGRVPKASEYCLKCGHHRTDDIPGCRSTPPRCRPCARKRERELYARRKKGLAA